MPWSQLAARLGTTPETLSRRLGSLADQGIIRQTGGRTVLILDLERLRKIAAG
jgi:CRP/FNR family transcriptional regulator